VKEFIVRRIVRWGALTLTVLAISACATGRTAGRGDAAAKRGDWDSAVAYYREALGRKPGSVELRVQLGRAQREASSAHLARARDLEAKEQLPGAAAEYRLAADLDAGNAFALAKAVQIEKSLREQADANRPPSRIEELRRQAAQSSPVPTLDPRTRVDMQFPRAAVRNILDTIAQQFGLNIAYDSNLGPALSNLYGVNFTDTPLEEALTQVLSANTMAFKITGPKAIFVYQDTQQNHVKFEDTFYRVFYISHGDTQEIIQVLTQMTTTGPLVRPVIQPVKSTNAIAVRATAPVLAVIEQMIATMDKPRAEVVIDVEILEIDRTRAKQLGVDLSHYALGFTLSPELAPANTPNPGFPPAEPPAFNLNTISKGVSTNDFYLNVPSAQIKLLESDSKTRLLAKPQLRGREGLPMQLNLGNDIPIITTSLLSSAAGGVPTVPQQAYQYRTIGVNLSVTPKVTYRDEIILDSLLVDKSGLGGDVNVGGQNLQTFIKRSATVNLQLRDGESSLLAGLILDEDRKGWSSLPGLLHIPFFRNLFGSSTTNLDQSEVVMVVTPHIIRSHELTVADLRPLPLGSGQNFGVGGVPTLISAGAPPAPGTVPLAGALPPSATGTATTTMPPAGQSTTMPPAVAPPPTTPPPATPPPSSGTGRAVGVVPVQAVGGADQPRPPTGPAQIIVSTPGTEFALSGGPYPVPVQITNASQVGTVALTITYNPAVLKATAVNEGTFLKQGGVTTTFVPKIDAAAGRVDIAISRNIDQTGASGATGLLAAIQFQAVAAGTSQISVTGVVTSVTGQAVAVQMVPANVVIK
jgi:general secretion pathway protein D